MASVKVIIREDWERRALGLAEAKHLTGTPRLLADGELMRVYHVPNGDRRGDGYTVRRIVSSGETRCECVASSYGRPCGHAGAVIHTERQREAAKNEPDDRMALWLMGFDW